MGDSSPPEDSPQHPIIMELAACLRRNDVPGAAERLGFPDGFRPMLVEGLRPLVGDPDFEATVRAISQLALALKKQEAPTASQLLVSVLKDEVIAAGIKSLDLGKTSEDVARTARSFDQFVGPRGPRQAPTSKEPSIGWLDALISSKTK